MEITTTARHSFEKGAVDITGPMTETMSGNKYILTFQDDLSKFIVAIPIPQQDAETIAKEFVLNIVLKFGAHAQILTDQGLNFLSDLFKNTCKLLKIKTIQTTAFHPESNGSLEGNHRVLAEYLRHYVREDQKNWDEWIPCVVYVYNTTVHTTTLYTPFELVYGFRSEVPSALRETPSVQYNYENYWTELRGRLQSTHEVKILHFCSLKLFLIIGEGVNHVSLNITFNWNFVNLCKPRQCYGLIVCWLCSV
jgi:hypothetical protein